MSKIGVPSIKSFLRRIRAKTPNRVERTQSDKLPGGSRSAAREQESDTVGYIERIGACELSGWVVSLSGQPLCLRLTCDENVYVPIVSWQPRADVSSSLGSAHDAPGFVAAYPAALRRKLRQHPEAIGRVGVTLSEGPVPRASNVVVSQTAAQSDPPALLPERKITGICTGSGERSGEIVLSLEYLDGFMLYGAVGPPDVCADAIRLFCNGKVLESAVVCNSEAIVQPNGSDQTDPAGTCPFEVELPGYLWQQVDSEGVCAIQVGIGEDRVPDEGIRLTHTHAAAWLSDIALGYFGDPQYYELLGLEHLHYLDSSVQLSPDVVRLFRDKAADYGLESYVDLPRMMSYDNKPEGALDDADKVAIWQVLRRFNEALSAWAGREDELLLEIRNGADLDQESWCWVIYSLAPFFSRLDKFDAVRDQLSTDQVEALATSDDEWRASLALPYLLDEGHLNRAAELLLQLPGKHRIWLNTECIGYLARHVAVAEAGVYDEKAVEKVAYGVINLLDHLRHDIWSRLHDVHLIEALAVWFDQGSRWNYWLRRALEESAIRVFGLCPTFWTRIEQPLSRQTRLFARLYVAHGHFKRLDSLLADRNEWACSSQSLYTAEAFFRRYDNAEMGIFAREFVCNRIGIVAKNTASFVTNEVAELLAGYGDRELVRLAAYPIEFPGPSREVSPEVRAILTEMADISQRAPKYPLQHEASEALKSLRLALEGNAAGLRTTAVNLQRAAVALCESDSRFVGLDLLADLRLFGSHEALSAFRTPDLLLHHCERAIDASSEAYWPPASLLAGLSKTRYLARLKDDAGSLALLKKSLDLLARQYRNRYLTIMAALEPPADCAWCHNPEDDNGDTLFVVYSCRKYLDSRIPAIRSTWLGTLKARNVPHVVIVGDGDDTIAGDVLALNVSDRYEDLPKKSLRLFEWVREHTDFQYVVKVDDDCYLDVDRFLDALSHRKFHYYGRTLHRRIGAMDRLWHQSKAQGERARRALDKSPEPSVYADGGTGYCLSRLALECLHQASLTAAGKRLIASSYMEDKLIGDLLHLSGIDCVDEDYYTYVRRRTYGDAVPISMWVNSFQPNDISPTKLVHLDTEKDAEKVHRQKTDRELSPKRIWPTHESPSIHFNSNSLELISPVSKAAMLLQEELVVIAVMRNEHLMLPHFLRHYRQLGIKTFIVIDNASDDGTREQLLGEPDVILYSADTEYRASHYGVSWQRAVLGNHCIGKWALLVDADELLVYPGFEQRPLADYVACLDRAGHDSARIMMIDMYPYGDLEDADFEASTPFEAANYFDAEPVIEWRIGGGYYGNTRNFTSALRHRLIRSAEPHAFMSQKYALLRYMPWIRLNQGLHNVGNIRPEEGTLCFAHFKYHAGFKQKVEIEVRRKQHFDGASEYQRYLGMVAESSGGFGSDGVSVPFVSSSSFSDALKAIDSGVDCE